MITCGRCQQQVDSPEPVGSGFTAGYYVAAAWREFCNAGEKYVCDACMWRDPRYIRVYGRQPAS